MKFLKQVVPNDLLLVKPGVLQISMLRGIVTIVNT